ncbi:thiamine ABC transporter substrate-binding protein [Halococcus hamelinensis]|uniref:ABC transporter substrate-binding protein n=1 Tax=Halococcus hamelinensis 100A6 TaxID=1132509 RepID=M0M4G5_9EURY|nr:thiamine ABC transporter substrate-binding protein [Halococcus hamelinensis]EMA40576.1 ABC transporter substrate-binding protein [Halococcus hamelinensis 100A6]
MKRRAFIRRAGGGAVGAALLAGCTSGDGSTNGSDSNGSATGGAGREGNTTGNTTATVGSAKTGGTLTVATYASFTGEDTAGAWLKSAFEKRHSNATVEFQVPENGVNQFVQRAQQGAPIDADLYVGLNTSELVRVRRQLDSPLFRSSGTVDGTDAIKQTLDVDPRGRAIPYDTGYITLVYDGTKVDEPRSFDALTKPRYANELITENAQQSDPGRAFLLWTVLAKGEDGYLDYWRDLLDNGVRVLADWEPAYQAFTDGEAPMVVSYSTDQVYYHDSKAQLRRHQVGFLDGQGYANPEAMAAFADAENPDLAREFMSFVLTDRAQSEIAVRNVQFPAVKGVSPGREFEKYAKEPPNPVTMSYDDLAGSVGGWVEDWSRLVASS